jgi:hypothetical protein
MAFGAGAYDYQVITGPTSCSNATFGGDDPTVGVLKTCYLAPQGAPVGYTPCAAENGTCTVNGTEDVAFGGSGAFRFTVATGSIACDTAEFGSDPLPGTVKNCYVAATGTPPGNWTQCAAEHGTCAATGSQPMAFGAGGAYWTTTTYGATTCSADTVGVDPVFKVLKSCYTETGPPPGFGTVCAAENSTCTLNGQQTVAFGADGDFVYRTFTGTVDCTDTAFGRDPIYGVAKSCYLVS